jgi:hypothetical protein
MNIITEMKYHQFNCSKIRRIIIILTIILYPFILTAQEKFTYGVQLDPIIGWFKTDVSETKNVGARPGFNLGFTFNTYFTPNISLSTGISYLSAGGRLVSSDTTVMWFTNNKTLNFVTVLPHESVVYKIHYLTFPVGMTLQTNQKGHISYFTDLGFDPKIVIGGKADILYLNIKDGNVMEELNRYNLAYHIGAGIEYSLGEKTALVLGLNLENNFLDITKDVGKQPHDKVSHKLLSFKIGIKL